MISDINYSSNLTLLLLSTAKKREIFYIFLFHFNFSFLLDTQSPPSPSQHPTSVQLLETPQHHHHQCHRCHQHHHQHQHHRHDHHRHLPLPPSKDPTSVQRLFLLKQQVSIFQKALTIFLAVNYFDGSVQYLNIQQYICYNISAWICL